ncbi:MAG: hypothetical protein NWE94_00905 [Candidatus Bathyarchaeota archaeon]|nr:hypothetical protein [Candidatus Bathyarchaeota archaeon]
MKTAILALILVLTLILSILIGTQLVNFASANPDPYKMGFKKQRHCNITIASPRDAAYCAEPILLNFTVKKVYVSDAYSYFYFLDGQNIQSSVKVEEVQLIAQETIRNDTFFPYEVLTLRGQAVLPQLSDGEHNVTVFVGWMREDGVIYPANIEPFSATTRFCVGASLLSPAPSLLPQETEAEPAQFPVVLVAVAAVSVIVASVSLVECFKKRGCRTEVID